MLNLKLMLLKYPPGRQNNLHVHRAGFMMWIIVQGGIITVNENSEGVGWQVLFVSVARNRCRVLSSLRENCIPVPVTYTFLIH